MGIIRSLSLIILIGTAVVGLPGSSARAALIELDLNAVGDKLITLDEATGQEWLDVTATLGLTYNAAEALPFFTIQGFRHANTTEVATLFQNFGIGIVTGAFSAANFAGVSALLESFGCSGGCGGFFPFTQAVADFDPLLATFATVPFVQLDFDSIVPQGRAAVLGLGQFANDQNAQVLGHWALRDASPNVIPLPAALPLYGTGLALMGFMGWRRKRKAIRNINR